jgi:tyrosyl-tRNA synthetase
MKMDVESKLALALRPPTEEIVQLDELRQLFETNEHPKHYVGFEISGLLHLGFLYMNGFKINDLTKAGVKCNVLLADWHTVMNRKLGGDWERIRKAAKYFEEAFKFYCPGVEVVYGSDLYRGNDDYWRNVIAISNRITLARDARCLTIMGRTEKESLSLAQYIYPPMQAADIKALEVDIAHAGMDQRKIHMLTREVFPELGWKKPVALHHRLMPGLTQPTQGGFDADVKRDRVIASKMSKSKPESCIFIHDSTEAIEKKLNAAWCPATVEDNPVLEFAKWIVFHEEKVFKVERDRKYGGDVEFSSYEELEKAYAEGKLHASDLKKAVAKYVDKLVSPARAHFDNKRELLEVFNEAEITR